MMKMKCGSTAIIATPSTAPLELKLMKCGNLTPPFHIVASIFGPGVLALPATASLVGVGTSDSMFHNIHYTSTSTAWPSPYWRCYNRQDERADPPTVTSPSVGAGAGSFLPGLGPIFVLARAQRIFHMPLESHASSLWECAALQHACKRKASGAPQKAPQEHHSASAHCSACKRSAKQQPACIYTKTPPKRGLV